MQDYKRDTVLQARLSSEVQVMAKEKDNRTCCDCGGAPTRYVSVKVCLGSIGVCKLRTETTDSDMTVLVEAVCLMVGASAVARMGLLHII